MNTNVGYLRIHIEGKCYKCLCWEKALEGICTLLGIKERIQSKN